MRRWRLLLWALALAASCSPIRADVSGRALQVKLDYPAGDTVLQMGQAIKTILEVHDEAGAVVDDAEVELIFTDASGEEAARIVTRASDDGVYRSAGVRIPHRTAEGAWTVTARATRPGSTGSASAEFAVRNSTSEDILQKYGFWVEDPSLGYIETTVGRERGDAENGDLIWGGIYVQMHVLKESWLEVYWRKGDFRLDSSQDVQDFLLDDVGNLGFTPLRQLGEFRRVKFKGWDAWRAPARGRLSQYDIEFTVFYAPEVDKTYAISTRVVLPPEGIDAHAVLRDGFEVHPELAAHGRAPEPLARLLPTPRLLSPPLGAHYVGEDNAIVLSWDPVKALGQDEYYRVKIDYDYAETNTSRYYVTREAHFVLPAKLFTTPNCGVFNWQVTLMRQTGVGEDGQPIGTAISYDSLHWYVEWRYPSTDQAPFQTHCQNPQT